jgi:PAS domain S-box-containing protein
MVPLVTGQNSGEVQGTLTVGYLEARPPLDEGPFAREKRNLLDAVAERIGKIVEHKLATAALAKSEKRLNDIVENALVGISIIQEGREVYRNPELRRLIGDVADGASFLEFSHVHPDDRKKVKSSFEALMAGLLPRVDMVCRFYPRIHRRSSLKWLYCRATRIDYRNKDAVLMNHDGHQPGQRDGTDAADPGQNVFPGTGGRRHCP